MSNFIPDFIDITNWYKLPYSSTGGTRAKNIYVSPSENKEYFFKGSKKLSDQTFRYPTEFWSEIIASKLGQMLQFNILNYEIGYDQNDEQQIGCLSKSMVDHSENKLTEGVFFLRGYDPKYNPAKDEKLYTYNFIKKTLSDFYLSEFESQFVEMLIFDGLIGNSDRHQENWGFISKFKETIQVINKELEEKKGFFNKFQPQLRKMLTHNVLKQKQIMEQNKNVPKKTFLKMQSEIVETVFSPIYDSGCCLGRELEEPKIINMLADVKSIEAYVNRGRSEVRWNEGSKTKHFELLKNLNNEMPLTFKNVIHRVNNNYSEEQLHHLIENIDYNLPEHLFKFKLSIHRKNLMLKLITLRIKKLNEFK